MTRMGSPATSAPLRMRTEMVLEMFSPFNLLTWLVAREDFIIHSRHESSKSYRCLISVAYQIYLINMIENQAISYPKSVDKVEIRKL
jgi:hypothetical protein